MLYAVIVAKDFFRIFTILVVVRELIPRGLSRLFDEVPGKPVHDEKENYEAYKINENDLDDTQQLCH
jgi:hypothetical protein